MIYYLSKGEIMYYVGEILHEDLDIHGRPIIELWNDMTYSLKQAKEKIKEIENMCGKTDLEIINDKEYDVVASQGWE
jgi:hypothetical protein